MAIHKDAISTGDYKFLILCHRKADAPHHKDEREIPEGNGSFKRCLHRIVGGYDNLDAALSTADKANKNGVHHYYTVVEVKAIPAPPASLMPYPHLVVL